MTLPRPSILAFILFLIALALLLPGITEVTGITGKDEYLLGLRTPLHMIEGGHGWLPWLDGEPRLKKPPLIYWLARASYETFGITLFSARIIGVFFAALLALVTGLIARAIYGDRQTLLFSGLVILGSLGVMIDGRRLMLDIPVAALSGLAILFMIYWRQHGRPRDILLSAVALGLAFLVKGPVAFFFYFAAMIALIMATSGNVLFLRRHWIAVVLAIVSFSLISVPWFVYLSSLYPELLANTFSAEVADRDLLNISLSPVLSLMAMSLPWSPVLIAILWYRGREESAVGAGLGEIKEDSGQTINNRVFLIGWLVLSLLPFFFFKSFSRYLYGSMIPLALLISLLLIEKRRIEDYRYWLRAGALFSVLIGSLLIFFLLWFRGFQPVVIAPLFFMLAFAICWWQSKNVFSMAFLSALYWLGILGMAYPALGINKLPDGVLEQVKGEFVVLYAGPQPAMLPIMAKRGMRSTNRLNTLSVSERDSCKGIVLISPVKHFITARMQLESLNHSWLELARYRVLSSRGSWLRIAHEDATYEDWKRAFINRDIDSLGTELILVRSKANQCVK